ncbi:hypothetical protein BMS3Bbin04_00752 [bacterium BMS3Bbin04]|nr:hypothetical protein BMS3Bbin04_00752 [bacterium BMS3Bbin04]
MDIVKGTCLHRHDSAFKILMSGNHDHNSRHRFFSGLQQQILTRSIWKHQVQENHLGLMSYPQLFALGYRRTGKHLMSLSLKSEFQGTTGSPIIIND